MQAVIADALRHGSASTYNNHACRCELCRNAWTDYTRRRRHGTAHLPTMDTLMPATPQHRPPATTDDAAVRRGTTLVRANAHALGREHGARGVSRPDTIPEHFRDEYLRGVAETWHPVLTPRKHRDLR